MTAATPTLLVTGAAGFIGSNFVRRWLAAQAGAVVAVDKLTYAGNLSNLAEVQSNPNYTFVAADICDEARMSQLMHQYRPSALINFAAETHVDRSIATPSAFIETNVAGTYGLLEGARGFIAALAPAARKAFRFVQISTDEVYGSLAPDAAPWDEMQPYAPNSPYAASKASADHLVRAYHATYDLPVLITNCCNNFGPNQYPEKLIPLVVYNAARGAQIPVYGDGLNVRDWLFVGDHCAALRRVLAVGQPGATYHVSARNERSNVDIVTHICDLVDELLPGAAARRDLIEMVPDRPGHDRRYALDPGKIEAELGWRPSVEFGVALRHTVAWYLDNAEWMQAVTGDDRYAQWMHANYANRSTA